MKGEIIAIGDELTSGRIFNTTSGFAARHLFDAGYEIYAMHTIGDSPESIGDALQRAIDRVDFVIVTGGLGSTDDDLTTEAVSRALSRPTMPNLEILSQIRKYLDKISGNPVNPLEKLAWLPEGAEALNPKARMAGYQLIHQDKPIFFLPGVPSQMEQLLLEKVLPRLRAWYSDPSKGSLQKLLRIFGMDEYEINEKIAALRLDKSIKVGYYPVFPELHLSLTIRNKEPEMCKALIANATLAIHRCLGDVIYGQNQDSLEQVVGRLLLKSGLKLAVAESCSGGMVSQRITRIPGSSKYFLGGVTSYANSMKSDYLDVPPQLIEEHGAVSHEVAESMAWGIRRGTGADICLSITGIAGPDGGSKEKPIGTVFMGLVRETSCTVKRFNFNGNREQIQELTTATGLDLVRHLLLADFS